MFGSHRFMVLAMVTVLATAVPTFAAQAKAGGKSAAKMASITGTLQKVDGQTLTVQTAKGPETVMLSADAKVRRAGKTLPASQLAGESGSRVTIRYSEEGGHKEARSVTLAAPAAAKTAKKS